MYLPPHFALTDLDEIVSVVEATGAVDLVTINQGGRPCATLLPVIWDRSDWSPDKGIFGVLRMHMARANSQWESIGNCSPGLAILHGPQAYVSPSAYASKREHGRVVPTWNYVTIHFEGEIHVSHDDDQLRAHVGELTELHESEREHPWEVQDAPESYISGQLRGIVAITMQVTSLSAKAKLSQNRSIEDRMGVAEDLGQSQDAQARLIGKLIANGLP